LSWEHTPGLGDRRVLIGVVNGDGGCRVVVDGSDRLGRGLVDGDIDVADGDGRSSVVVTVGELFTMSYGTGNMWEGAYIVTEDAAHEDLALRDVWAVVALSDH
jgi:hypothetical protein